MLNFLFRAWGDSAYFYPHAAKSLEEAGITGIDPTEIIDIIGKSVYENPKITPISIHHPQIHLKLTGISQMVMSVKATVNLQSIFVSSVFKHWMILVLFLIVSTLVNLSLDWWKNWKIIQTDSVGTKSCGSIQVVCLDSLIDQWIKILKNSTQFKRITSTKHKWPQNCWPLLTHHDLKTILIGVNLFQLVTNKTVFSGIKWPIYSVYRTFSLVSNPLVQDGLFNLTNRWRFAVRNVRIEKPSAFIPSALEPIFISSRLVLFCSILFIFSLDLTMLLITWWIKTKDFLAIGKTKWLRYGNRAVTS